MKSSNFQQGIAVVVNDFPVTGVNGFRVNFLNKILIRVLNGFTVPAKGIEITCAIFFEIENQIAADQLSRRCIV
jgi:hypothetical protein